MNINFDDLKEKAKDLAQTGVAKAKEFTDTAIDKGKQLKEISKLNVQNASERENMKKAYIELGKLYFSERGSAPEAPYADLCDKISTAQAKVEYNTQRIADLKAAGGFTDQEVEDAEFEYTENDASEDGCEGGCCSFDNNSDKPEE